MCRKTCGRCRRLPIRMTIRLGSGGQNVSSFSSARMPTRQARMPALLKDRGQLVWWDDFELAVSAVFRDFVGAPAAELRHVTEAIALHVLVGDLDHQFWPKRLPG